MKLRGVLGGFDGISCGQVALQRAGITYEQYYASEIDTHAIKVTQNRFPDTIQLGSIEDWKEWKRISQQSLPFRVVGKFNRQEEWSAGFRDCIQTSKDWLRILDGLTKYQHMCEEGYFSSD